MHNVVDRGVDPRAVSYFRVGMIRFRFVGALFALALSLLPATLAAKPKSVSVKLVPVRAASALPDEFTPLPLRSDYPIAWEKSLGTYFPRELEHYGIEGEVTAEFVVNPRGFVVYAKILEATDERFADSVLLMLSHLRPDPTLPRDPQLPARFIMPIGFSLRYGSALRDPDIVAKIKIQKPTKREFAFTKPFDLNPIYPGAAAAKKLLRRGMPSSDALDALGEPKVIIEGLGGFSFGFGPDPAQPEVIVHMNRQNRVERFEFPRRPR
ncbi:MAG: hypothetical protein C0518_08410 [Opitutus sp.]|nr:hypothetical protein [Opitutus sp.]